MTYRAVLLLFLSVGWWRVPAAGAPDARSVWRSSAVLFGLLIGLTAVGRSVLGWLEVDHETFRIAAGLVLVGAGAVRALGAGLATEIYASRSSWLLPFTYPVLVGPETVLAALSIGTDHGFGLVLPVSLAAGASVFVMAKATLSPRSARLLARACGVAVVVLAVALVFDGLRDI